MKPRETQDGPQSPGDAPFLPVRFFAGIGGLIALLALFAAGSRRLVTIALVAIAGEGEVLAGLSRNPTTAVSGIGW